MRTAAPGASPGYSYGGTAYADPDAVTQIANGLSTTTLVYDADGNVTQKTVNERFYANFTGAPENDRAIFQTLLAR